MLFSGLYPRLPRGSGVLPTRTAPCVGPLDDMINEMLISYLKAPGHALPRARELGADSATDDDNDDG